MSVEVVVQYAVDPPTALPSKKTITIWVKAALAGRREEAQVTVRIVDEEEGAELNQRWRKRAGPTNVLSFPSTGLERIAPALGPPFRPARPALMSLSAPRWSNGKRNTSARPSAPTGRIW